MNLHLIIYVVGVLVFAVAFKTFSSVRSYESYGDDDFGTLLAIMLGLLWPAAVPALLVMALLYFIIIRAADALADLIFALRKGYKK